MFTVLTVESRINDAIRNNASGTNNAIQVPVTDTESQVAKVELTGDISSSWKKTPLMFLSYGIMF